MNLAEQSRQSNRGVMTTQEKHKAIIAMKSIGQLTSGHYPTLSNFEQALNDSRVVGTYGEKIVIVSNDPHKEYTFIQEETQ